MRRFELVEGSAAKFWQIEVVGSSFSVGWGRLGTTGQTQTKTFEDVAKAQAQADKLIREKTGKGYREVVAEGATAAAPQAVTPKAAPENTAPSDTAKALDPAPVQTPGTPLQSSARAEAETDSARAKAGDRASAAGVVVEPIPDPEPIDWTPEWLAICPALPGRPGPPLPNDLNAVWNALCKRRLAAGLDKFRENYLARLGLAGAGELLQRESPLPASSPAADALYFALFPYAQTSDFLVLLGGLRHAFETIVAAFEIRQVGYAVEGLVMLLHPWLALRRHIVAAPPELYHELCQEAERVSASAPALVTCRIAMLFPGEPWVRKAALELKPSNPADLICLILDAGSIEETRSLIQARRTRCNPARRAARPQPRLRTFQGRDPLLPGGGA